MNNKKNNPGRIESVKHVNRHYNSELDKTVVSISPGGLYITQEDEVISTVLGSCVSVCASDTVHGIGGMNHFMVPGDVDDLQNSNQEELLKLGIYAVGYLLDQLYSLGAKKQCLEIKVFGGGAIISSAGDVGNSNIDFVMHYIEKNQLNLVSHDLGGQLPRKLNYLPKTGQVYMKRLRALHKRVVAEREKY